LATFERHPVNAQNNMIESIELESHELKMRPITSSDGKKIKLFKASSVNVIIGTNGSGKTRALRLIAAAMRESGEAFGCRVNFAGAKNKQATVLNRTGVIFFTPIPFFVELPPNERRFINATTTSSNHRDSISIDFQSLELLKEKLGIRSSPVITMACDDDRLLAVLSRLLVRVISQAQPLPAAFSNLPVDAIRKKADSILRVLSEAEMRKTIPGRSTGFKKNSSQDLGEQLVESVRQIIVHTHQAEYLPVMTGLQSVSDRGHDNNRLSIDFFKVALGMNFELRTEYRAPRVSRESTVSDLKEKIELAKKIYNGEDGWSVTRLPWQLQATIDYKSAKNLIRYSMDELQSIVSVGWDGFSSGQLALLNQFTNIAKHAGTMVNAGIEEILLLLDEGDIFLHASWQQRYVELLNTLTDELLKIGIRSVQIILTTHSASVITDIPSRYIVRLDSDGDSDSRQIRGFAAAPQDILNSSFEADAIGSFAKKILTETARNIKKNGGSARDHAIVSLIDDPVIRREFERLVSIFNNK
jgi:predicted ATPase